MKSGKGKEGTKTGRAPRVAPPAKDKKQPDGFDDLRGLLKILSGWDGKVESAPSADFFQSLEDAIISVSAVESERVKKRPTLQEAVTWLDKHRRREVCVVACLEEAIGKLFARRHGVPLIHFLIQDNRWESQDVQNLVTELRSGKTNSSRWSELIQPFCEIKSIGRTQVLPLPGVMGTALMEPPQIIPMNIRLGEVNYLRFSPFFADSRAPSWSANYNVRLWPLFEVLMNMGIYGKNRIDPSKKEKRKRQLNTENQQRLRACDKIKASTSRD